MVQESEKKHPPPCARGPGAFSPTAGQGLWVLVFAGACQGTAWAGLCLIHHHQESEKNDVQPAWWLTWAYFRTFDVKSLVWVLMVGACQFGTAWAGLRLNSSIHSPALRICAAASSVVCCVLFALEHTTRSDFVRPQTKSREMHLPLTHGQSRRPEPHQRFCGFRPRSTAGRPAPQVAPGSTHGRSFGVRIKGVVLQSTGLTGRFQVAFQKAAVLLGVFVNGPRSTSPN